MASIATQTHNKPLRKHKPVPLTGVKIVGTGSHVPEKVVKNSDLTKLGCDEQWIVQRTGILQRRHCTEDQSTSDLAFLAGQKCLKNAGVEAKDVDMIIVATMTPDHFTPSTAAIVQNLLGCQAVAMDLNAACTGFIYSLVTAAQFVMTGSYHNILVIGADAMSRVIDPQDVKTYPLFGDGAGAVLVAPDPNGSSDADQISRTGIRSYQLGTAGDLGHLISVPGACARMPASQRVIDERQQFLKMDGKPVFKWAVRIVPHAINEILELAGLNLDQIDMFLLHQANRRIIDAALEGMPIPERKVFANLENYGNTSAASIPLLLDEAIAQGATNLEERILMCGFGAGLTWGSCIYQG